MIDKFTEQSYLNPTYSEFSMYYLIYDHLAFKINLKVYICICVYVCVGGVKLDEELNESSTFPELLEGSTSLNQRSFILLRKSFLGSYHVDSKTGSQQVGI